MLPRGSSFFFFFHRSITYDGVQASRASNTCFFCSPPSLLIHPSSCAALHLRPPRPSGVPSSHCAASRLILPSPITEGCNYGGCRPPSGEPFVMWTGLDRAELRCNVLFYFKTKQPRRAAVMKRFLPSETSVGTVSGLAHVACVSTASLNITSERPELTSLQKRPRLPLTGHPFVVTQ